MAMAMPMASKQRRKRHASRGTWYRQQDSVGRQRRIDLDKALQPHERAALGSWHWEIWARDEQLPPDGEWRVWLICAGRGFGKTRAGAEWVRNVARHDGAARIALVGASLTEVRSVMVEGESGLLAAAPGALVPEFEPSLRRLQWPNGAQAFLYSAGEPEALRGPQHSHAFRPDAKGVFRQPGHSAVRQPASPCDRKRNIRSSGKSPGRRNVACRSLGHRRLGRA